MTEQDETTDTADTAEDAPQQTDAADAVKKGGLIILIIILITLGWYLLADRFTPYTTQARLQGYIVGVAPKVAGLVTQIWVRNNQEVEKGGRLFEIDPSQYRIALEKAKSDLENARNQVGAGDAAVESARANLLSAKANELKAQQDTTRLTRLHREDPGTISVRRLELSQANLQQAKAKVTSAEAKIQQAIEQKGGDDETNNAILKSALSAVKKAELDLANTIVRASSRGVITDLRADVGQFAGAGSPVMTLVAIHDVWINAEFTENNLGHIRVGSPVAILFDVMPGQIFEGEVRSIGLGVSTGKTQPAGTLPKIDNNRDWLRQSQRFPVVVGFDVNQQEILRQHLRVGGQASVMAFSEGHGVLKFFGKFYLRIMSILSYAY
jgi:multidrug resistance efflux pump